MKSFLKQFAFKPELAGCLGVEREYFLTNRKGRPMPNSPAFLALVSDPAWTYELSACQVEHRTKPHRNIEDLFMDLEQGQIAGRSAAGAIGCRLAAMEVAPENMPLDVYPFSDRYLEIAGRLPKEILAAACRVTGTHVHYGVASIEDAIYVHNRLRDRLDAFAIIGDHSKGERSRLYKMMAPNWFPPRYESVSQFYETAVAQGFADNPRNCWHLVRISRHGTVELRAFGVTDDVRETLAWCEAVRYAVNRT